MTNPEPERQQAAEAAASAAANQIDALADDARTLLTEMIRFPSVGGKEDEVQEFLASWLREHGMPAEMVAADPDIESDPNYSHHSLDGKHVPNLKTFLPSRGSGRSLFVNSHTDVVPAENPAMFEPVIDGDTIRGRGAADAKGQVVTWVLAMLAIKQAGITLDGECVGVAVTEEEVGGNGALAWVRQAEPRDAALVLEPTSFGIHPANRGAIWFKITTEGVPTHMGRWWEGQSAFENLEAVLAAVREWDARLVAESQGVPLFPDNPSPVHVNIGIVRAGDWPAKVPATAEAEGGVSFLPNKNLGQIREEMTAVVAQAARQRGITASVVFEKLQNEAYATPEDHPAVAAFRDASVAVRGAGEVTGFLASCDARLFYHRGRMPTIVFGPGDLLMAHSDIESIQMSDIVTAAKIVARFILSWCGVAR